MVAGEFARFMLPGHDAWFLSPTFGGAYDWLGDHSCPACSSWPKRHDEPNIERRDGLMVHVPHFLSFLAEVTLDPWLHMASKQCKLQVISSSGSGRLSQMWLAQLLTYFLSWMSLQPLLRQPLVGYTRLV